MAKINWKKEWKVGERKRVRGFDGVDAYRTKKHMPNGEPVMSFRYHIEGHKPVKVGKSNEGVTVEKVVLLRAEHIDNLRSGKGTPDYCKGIEGPWTLQQGWDAYIKYQMGVHPKSGKNHKSIWNQRIAPKFADWVMSDIDHTDVQLHMAHLLKQGYTPGSINAVKLVITSIYKYCLAKGHCEGGNPGILVNRLDEVSRDRFLTMDEVGPFLNFVEEAGSPKAELQINLMLYMGLRRSEVRGRGSLGTGEYGVRWEDINWDEGTIRFVRKGNKIDDMPMPKRIKDMLIAYGPRPSGFVFDSFAGEPIRKLISDFGLNTPDKTRGMSHMRVTPHTFRHTFCTWLGQVSNDPKATQHLMNHKHSATTDRYTHQIPEAQRKAMDSFGDFMDGLVSPAKVIQLHAQG